MYTTPEASLNRVLINSENSIYKGQTGRALLSADSINKIKAELGENWYIEFCIRFSSLLENVLTGNPWPSSKSINNIICYWRSCRDIVIGGGVLSGFTERIEDRLKQIFLENFPNKSISVLKDCKNMPINGLINKFNVSDGLYVDFGHTGVKFLIISNGIKKEFKTIPINLDSSNLDTSIEYSINLHKKITSILKDILVITEFTSGEIFISIAAYLKDDDFQKNFRGAYCMLANIDTSCKNIFKNIFFSLGIRNFRIYLFHDGEASAFNLKTSPSAVIIFGTSLAYGFL